MTKLDASLHVEFKIPSSRLAVAQRSLGRSDVKFLVPQRCDGLSPVSYYIMSSYTRVLPVVLSKSNNLGRLTDFCTQHSLR